MEAVWIQRQAILAALIQRGFNAPFPSHLRTTMTTKAEIIDRLYDMPSIEEITAEISGYFKD